MLGHEDTTGIRVLVKEDIGGRGGANQGNQSRYT